MDTSEETHSEEAHISEFNSVEGLLGNLRGEVMQALELYLSHMKHTMALMSSMIAAALALVAFSVENGEFSLACRYAAVVLLVSTLPVSLKSARIVRRFYKIYACNYIHSARLNQRLAPSSVHPWNADLLRSSFFESIADLNNEDAADLFLDYKCIKRVGSSEPTIENHSWFHYKQLIHGIGIVSFIVGLILLAFVMIFPGTDPDDTTATMEAVVDKLTEIEDSLPEDDAKSVVK